MVFGPLGQQQGIQTAEFSQFSLEQGKDFAACSIRDRVGIKILPNAGQEQGKVLEEPAAYTHGILSRFPWVL